MENLPEFQRILDSKDIKIEFEYKPDQNEKTTLG